MPTRRDRPYTDIGVTSFILSGYPNLEETSIPGKVLLPVFRAKWEQRRNASAVGI
ncbi:hypothetical protein AB4Z29_24340 [Paenibacillus sp. 2TAB23]|uniref:hypothetical protein n=1 Tax=Paenibacillus sp. 2TAB23 TaxID=3233004 RepID=UPI003F967CED